MGTSIMFRTALALLLISFAVADAFVSKHGGVGLGAVGVGAVGVGGSTTVVHSRKHMPVVGGFGLGGIGGYGGFGGYGGYGLGGFGGYGLGGFGGYGLGSFGGFGG